MSKSLFQHLMDAPQPPGDGPPLPMVAGPKMPHVKPLTGTTRITRPLKEHVRVDKGLQPTPSLKKGLGNI